MKTKLLIGLFGMLSSLAWAAPSSFSFSGTLLTPGTSNPIVDPTVTLKLEIYDPTGTCLLYRESQTVNTTATNGDFAVSVGSDPGNPKRIAGDPGLAWATIYQGVGLITGCYTAAVADPPRVLRVTVTTSVLPPTTLSPDYALNSVPMATVADTLSPNSTINGSLTIDNGILGLKMASGPQVGFMGPASGTPYTMTLPGTPGSSGSALTTDGTGNLSWMPMPTFTPSSLDTISSNSGSMMYRGPSSWQQIPAGTANTVLAWNGSSPAWQPITASMVPFALSNTGNSGAVTMGSLSAGTTILASGTAAMTLTPSGNVGVGTTLPADKFDVLGNVGVTGTLSATNALVVSGPANLASVQASSGSAAAPSLAVGGVNEGLFDAAGSMGFSTSSQERMRIAGSGAVGIGTTLPNAQLLDVSTSANLTSFPQVTINNTSTTSSMPNVKIMSQGFAPALQVTNMGAVGGALAVGPSGTAIRQITMVTVPGSPCGAATAGSTFTCTVNPGGFTPPSGTTVNFIQCSTTTAPFVSFPGVFSGGQFILGGVAQSSGTLSTATFSCQVTSF